MSTKVWKSFIDGPQKFLWYDLNTISWKKIFDLQYSSGNIVFDNHAITNRIPKKNFIIEKNLFNKKSRKSCIFRSKFFSFWWTIYIYWVKAKKRLFLGLSQKKALKVSFLPLILLFLWFHQNEKNLSLNMHHFRDFLFNKFLNLMNFIFWSY